MIRLCVFSLLALAVFEGARSELLTANVARAAEAVVVAPSPSEPSQNKQLNDGDNCDETSYSRIVCQDDRLKFCGPNNKILSAPCFVNGKQGFCNCERDECVAQRPVCEDVKTPCLVPGQKLPDNLNCHKFTYCNENSEKITLECAGNLIYDPRTGKCADQTTAQCTRFVCPKPGNNLQLIPFPQARNYYLLCYKGVGDVRQCPFPYYAVRTNKCQFDCKLRNASGLFRDTDVNRCRQGYYYSCRRAGTNFTTVQAKCPAGKFFDENLGLCTSVDTCAAQN